MTNVSNQIELQAAIAAQETEIVVTASFEIDRQMMIMYRLTVSGDENGPYTLTKRPDFNLSVFDITNRGELTIRNIILDGEKDSHTEDPASESLVTVNGGALLLDTGSVLQNNYAYEGGGVFLSGGSATSNLFMQGNAVIRNNTAANGGGGIECYFSMTGNAVEISGNAEISNNAASDGGGIHFTGTANNMLYIRENVRITGNTATANGGGINAPNGSVFLAGSVEISGNNAANGGGVAFSGSGITVEEGVTIGNNTATRKGGGVYINSDESQVSVHGLIQGNTSPKTGGVFIENTARGSLDFSRARFVENVSNGAEGDGGGLNYFRETGEPSTLAITLSNTVFDGNRTGRNGGGMQIACYVSSTVNLTVDGCRFENNVATNVGGGMYIDAPDSTVLLQNSTVSKNNARAGGGCAVSQILPGQSVVTLQNVTISENRATSNAGGLLLGGNQAVTLSGVTIEKNSAGQNGGGIECSQGSGSLTIDNDSRFLSNHAGMEGGGFNIYNSKTVTLENVTFSQNTARSGNDFFFTGELRIGSSVYLLSGIYIENVASVPAIIRNLSAGSVIQYEQSYYVFPFPSGTPILIATSDLTLSPEDAAAFRVPNTEGFAGWEVKLSDDQKQVLIAPEVYDIAYENTRGAENPNPSTYTVVTPTITFVDLPSASAYRFLGWFDAPEGGNRVTEIPQGSTGDRILFATWQSIVHTVTYYGNDQGGPSAENVPLPQSVLDSESVVLSDESPTRTGYLFLNWNTAPDGTGITYHPEDTVPNVTADISLYAQWQLLPPTEHVLAYHPNDDGGPSAHNMPDNIAVTDGDTAHISTIIPIRDSFAFTGWNTAPDGRGTAYAPGDTIPDVRQNIDLHAQWAALPPPPVHTVTYHGNEEGDPQAQWIPYPVSIEDGQSVKLSPAIPTRNGFLFTGWNTAWDGTGSNYFPGQIIGPFTSDVDLYAQWQVLRPKYFRICFMPNARCACDVCCMPPSMTVLEQQSATIPCCFPNRPCYAFMGWNTRADGCGVRYAPGQSISVDKDLTLFAQWC